MESPRKFNDCYFYYYSTCTKGDHCDFRHEPTALGCETMCSAWQQGKCLDKRCKLRHMELRKNRKQIPCYWENQPGGCRKIHCPFMHKNPEARTDGIAPSQPVPMPIPGIPITGAHEPVVPAEPPMAAVPAPQPVPQPVPMLWQQQRPDHLPPVVMDSTLMGVLPPPNELRRLLTPHHAHSHQHEQAPSPYAPLPVDPLVVNFEEESDNESAPSTTPTKADDSSKSQELLLLERIQAESAAYYHYDSHPPEMPKDRKLVRTNLTTKYDKVSLDEIAGKKQPTQEQRNLDFKVLSLDEIRARKTKNDTILPLPPITINLRKRKLSTQETVTSSGNKILKVVRSNSIVYKKLDQNTPATSSQTKVQKPSDNSDCRKRTFSEQSDVCDLQEDELEDCLEFKRIKVGEETTQNKPRLIRNRITSENKDNDDSIPTETIICNADNDSDGEVQIVSVDISNDLSLDKIYDSDIEVEPKAIEIVDLSDDDSVISAADLDLDLTNNVPDVVASCQRRASKDGKLDDSRNVINEIDDSRSVINEIDEILNDNS